MKCINLDQSDTFFPQDADIDFIEDGHKYIYKGVTEFTPVSTLYSSFFKKFDAQGIAAAKSRKSGKMVEQYLEEWACTRDRAAEVGTFMHKQIENSFNGLPTEHTIEFSFDGIFARIHELIDINRELEYFRKFRQTLQPAPFRTEWCVFDPENQIAGTIDLICKNADGTYEMFDWKRSQKVNPDDKPWHMGINGLEHIPDTAYWHYVLQQNTYRHMLETFYDVKVNGMHLVVLHPDNPGYIIFDVPRKEGEVKTMLERFTL